MHELQTLDDRLVTVPELAAILAVPESWVYQQTASGRIPHIRVGRYVRFRLPDVFAWLAERGN